MDECNSLIRDPILQSFDSGIQIDEDQGDCQVVFPFSRVDGDPIILYVKEGDGKYTITDEGETHGMLFLSGVDIDGGKRENRVEAAKERFGLDEAVKEIRLTTSPEELGSRLLDAYQAVQWISFLRYTRRPYSPSYFKDKVASFLRSNEYKFEEDVKVKAESEDQEVDFSLSNLGRPTYLESIQARDGSDLRNKSKDTSYKWIKIGRAQPNSRFITVIDDLDGEFQKANMAPLFDDSDAVIPWTERDDLTAVINE